MLAAFLSLLILIVLFFYKPLSNENINYIYFLKKIGKQKRKKDEKKEKTGL